MEQFKDKALEYHRLGYNCCQSVCAVFAEKLNFNEDVLFKISEGFGAGMGNLQGSCGALSAAVMIAGLCNSGGLDAPKRTKAKTYKLVSEISNEFANHIGSIYCKDIKGIKTGKVLKSCDECISEAVDIINQKFFE